jgi:hypothetical protein
MRLTLIRRSLWAGLAWHQHRLTAPFCVRAVLTSGRAAGLVYVALFVLGPALFFRQIIVGIQDPTRQQWVNWYVDSA